jgi:hypothetical protein
MGARFLRHPRTKQAKSVAVLDSVEGVPPRGKRTAVNLPDAWDDKRVAARDDRSWKRFRKLKWRRIFNI